MTTSTILSSFDRHVSLDPGHEFVVDDRGDSSRPRSWTYGDASVAVDRLARAFSSLGLQPGDRVVLRMANSWEFIVVLLATWRVGAVAVPTIRQYAPQELRHALVDSGARILVFDDADHGPVTAAAPEGVVLLPARSGTQTTDTTLEDLLQRDAPPLPTPPPGPGDHAMIFYTSGTTSRSKGVILSHRAVLLASLGNAEGWRIRPDDRGYIVLPLFHCNAMFMQLLALLVGGATAVLGERFSASSYLDEVRRHRITLANLTAGAIRSVLAQPERDDDRTHELRMLTFGLPLRDTEIEEVHRRYGLRAYMAYGLTESATGGTRSPLHLDPRAGWQSVGIAQAGWEVATADEAGNHVGPDEVGEILLRGPGVMTGYWNRPEETAEVLRDGWLHTGDLGWLDADGRLFFHSRKKDMLKPKGENVAASEIEDVLVEHESVIDAAVVGVPDPHREERILAFVVPATPGLERTEDLLRYCAERLAAFKVPSEVLWVDDLPRTSIGKLNKGELRRLVGADWGPGANERHDKEGAT